MEKKNTYKFYAVIAIVSLVAIIAHVNRSKKIAKEITDKQSYSYSVLPKTEDNILQKSEKEANVEIDSLSQTNSLQGAVAYAATSETLPKSKILLKKNNIIQKDSIKEGKTFFSIQKGFTLPTPAGLDQETNTAKNMKDDAFVVAEIDSDSKEKYKTDTRNVISIDGLDSIHKDAKGFPVPKFEWIDPKLNNLMDYNYYGEFKDVDTKNYRYVIRKRKEIKEDIGAGLYPNAMGVRKQYAYKKYLEEGSLDVNHWQALDFDDQQLAFYIWVSAKEDPGVKTFFTAKVLQDAGHILPAIKAYYAAIVHFPRSASWSVDGRFVWYIGPAAIRQIEQLCKSYPELQLEIVDAKINIINGFDTDLSNDIIFVNPGRLVRK